MIPATPQGRRDFIAANTRLQRPPHVAEIALHLADEITPIWKLTEEALEEIGLPPPFWAFAWAGGQALARYLIDNPEIVAGRRVLDFAAGSGLVGIAAMKAGLAAGGEAGPVHSAGMILVRDVSWPVADLRIDWRDDDPIAALEDLWRLWKPQMDAYITRALDPSTAPAYGVPGDR